MNKNLKKLFLFTTIMLILLSIGAIYASDTENNSMSLSDNVDTIQEQSSIEEDIDIQTDDNKNIKTEKDDEKRYESDYTSQSINKEKQTIKTAEETSPIKGYTDIAYSYEMLNAVQDTQFQYPVYFTNEALQNTIGYRIDIDGERFAEDSINTYTSFEEQFLYTVGDIYDACPSHESNAQYVEQGIEYENHTLTYTIYVDDQEYTFNSKLIFADVGDVYNLTLMDSEWQATFNYTCTQGEELRPDSIYGYGLMSQEILSGSIDVYVDDEYSHTVYMATSTLTEALFSSEVTSTMDVGEHIITLRESDPMEIRGIIQSPYIKVTIEQAESSIITPTVEIDDYIGYRGDTLEIVARVTSNQGSTDGADVGIYLDDEEIGRDKVVDEIVSVSLPIDTTMYLGDYTLKAIVTANEYFETSEATSTLTVSKKTVEITVGDYETTKDGVVTITPTFNDTLTDGKLYVSIDQTSIATIYLSENSNPSIEYNTSSFTPGENTITVEYSDSELFEDTSATGTLTLTTRTLEITPSATTVPKGDTTTITITLNETVSDGTIVVKINDETINTQTITEETNSITLEDVETTNYNIGDNTITVEYTDSELYDDATGEGTLTLTTRTLEITPSATTVPKADTTTVTIEFNETVSDGSVVVKINDETINTQTITEETNSITLENIETTNYNIGDNTITVEYTDSELYEDTSATGTLTLTTRSVQITPTATTVPKGDTTTLTIDFNETVSDGSVIVKINDETINTQTITEETNSITIEDIETANYNIGENTITVEYSSSELYEDTSATGTLTLTTRSVQITPTATTVPKGDTTTLTIDFNETVSDGSVIVKINDETINTQTITEETNSITIEDIETANYNIGENTITVEYSSSELFEDASATGTLTLTTRTLEITPSATTVPKGDTTTITITLNETVSDGTIVVKINEETINTQTITEETNSITLEDVETANYNISDNTITVEYTDSELYEDTTGEGTLTLTTRTLTITPTATTVPKADTTTITITLNETITDGTITVKINEETINTQTITEETNSITLEDVETTNYNIGDNTITIEYSGSQLYDDATGEGILTIERRSVELTADSVSITKDISSTQITITLNESVSDGIIELSVNDEVIGQATISEETNSITVDVDTSNLAVGDNEVTISYSGSELYDDTTATSNINVVKSTTTITVDPVTVSKTQNTTITATITGENTDVLVNGGKIVFKVNGITLKDENGKVIYVTVTDGVATLSYDFTGMNIEGKTITAVYSGSNTYKASRSANATMEYESLDVVLTVESVTAIRGSNVTFTATVKDTNANDVNDGKVIFKINGKTIKDSEGKVIYATVTNGIATANYELASNFKVKDFTLTAVYISNIYNRQTANATLTVTSTE